MNLIASSPRPPDLATRARAASRRPAIGRALAAAGWLLVLGLCVGAVFAVFAGRPG